MSELLRKGLSPLFPSMEGAAKGPSASDPVSLHWVASERLPCEQGPATEEVAPEEAAMDEEVSSFKVFHTVYCFII